MIAKAKLRFLRSSPQKVRLVVHQIRGKGVEDALALLHFSPKRAARDLEKLLKSAVANAEQREERVDVDQLRVARAVVDEGPMLKRIRFASMGRAFRVVHRTSHVTVELDLPVRPVAAPAPQEPRPRKAAPTKRGGGRRGAAAAASGGRKRAATGAATKKGGRTAKAK